MQVDLLFIVWNKFARAYTALDPHFQFIAEAQFIFHVGFKPVKPVLPLLLGVVHGNVSSVHQRGRIKLSIIRKARFFVGGDPDRHGGFDFDVVHLYAFAQAFKQANHQLVNARCAEPLKRHDKSKFVTAQTRNQCILWQFLAQAIS